MTHRRVVVTGLGMISSLGNTVADTWHGIVNGKSGIATISHFDASAFTTQFSASVQNLIVDDYFPSKEARKMDPFIQYGMIAGIQAIRDSGLEVTEENADRIGVSIGSGIGGIGTIEEGAMTLDQKGPRRISPFFVPSAIINMISGNLSIMHNMRGPNVAITTACTTGTHSIGFAARMIQHGDADVMVAGGAEMATTPLGLGGFAAARALSTRNNNPSAASRPWDKDQK